MTASPSAFESGAPSTRSPNETITASRPQARSARAVNRCRANERVSGTAVHPVEPAHQGRHRSARGPERENEADREGRPPRAIGHAREGVVDQGEGVVRDHPVEAVDDARRARPRDLPEDPTATSRTAGMARNA